MTSEGAVRAGAAQARTAAATDAMADGLALLASALQSLSADSSAIEAGRRSLSMLALESGSDGPAADCRSCPVCRLLAVLRAVSPEAVDALGDALDALEGALRDEVHPS